MILTMDDADGKTKAYRVRLMSYAAAINSVWMRMCFEASSIFRPQYIFQTKRKAYYNSLAVQDS